MNDQAIARSVTLKPIADIALKLGIGSDALLPYGRHKAKVDTALLGSEKRGALVLVTAINPTPAGEGKTTVSIGLADALARRGERAALALREPSLGPVFGVKGGATGGGYAQVAPMEDINLHFTGDLHAITTANNLLAAMIDNHIFANAEPRVDPRTVTFRRCMDMNDRQLRSVISGLGGKSNGIPREEGFDITAASEVMASFCLADDLGDLKARLGRIVVGRAVSGGTVTAGDIGAAGAMTALLKDAFLPNLVQTLEGTPAFIHGGPFANIAHGCNSVVATRAALSLADIVVTEAGFGADLGAEKFLDIKCRRAGLKPSCCVIVATVRALKYHGGVKRDALSEPSPDAVSRGLPNLLHHIRTMREVYGLPALVALNRFLTDTDAELQAVMDAVRAEGASVHLTEVWAKGGEGALTLADEVAALCSKDAPALRFAYPMEVPAEEKLRLIATRIYGAKGITLAPGVKTKLKAFGDDLPVCVAKTQYSLSDNPKRLGEPRGFDIAVRDVRMSAGAGFIVAMTGDIIAMPGLPPEPAAKGIDVDGDGRIEGVF